MSKINFIKMSGAGNDFIIVDVRKNHYQFSAAEIAKMSNRKNIGCDQFILIKASEKADIFMDIYNSDGSRSGSCGNATRCVADIIMREKSANSLIIETLSGLLSCERRGDLIAVNMGQPKFHWKDIPLSQEKNTNNFLILRRRGSKYPKNQCPNQKTL
jgi:diaminopimelate epimerase